MRPSHQLVLILLHSNQKLLCQVWAAVGGEKVQSHGCGGKGWAWGQRASWAGQEVVLLGAQPLAPRSGREATRPSTPGEGGETGSGPGQ
jgi:hypothetical protein